MTAASCAVQSAGWGGLFPGVTPAFCLNDKGISQGRAQGEDSLLAHTLSPQLQGSAKRRIIQIMGTSYIFYAQNLISFLETNAALP